MQVLWGYDAIHPVRERWHNVVSVPDCFSTCEYLHRTASTRVVLVQPNPEILVFMITRCDRYSPLALPPPPVDCWLQQRGVGISVFEASMWWALRTACYNLFRCLWVLTSTRCQYLQVLWGYDAIYPVRERWHYVVSVPDCFSTCEYLHRTASTRVVLVQPNPEILVHDLPVGTHKY